MRDYQLTIYGATGFTGKLACEYMLKTYPDVRWAIAGRSKSKLEALATELNDVPGVVVADGSDPEALKELASKTVAVATTAGPFSRYGSLLVQKCAEEGTHYCDITGESDWVRDMITRYDDIARSSGARIVHLCGHDSVPWDLSAAMLSKKLKEKGDQVIKFDFYDDILSSPSGGTLETAFGIISGSDSQSTSTKKADFDPLLKKADGTKAASKFKIANVGAPQAADEDAPPEFGARSFFFMAGVNANTVKRSNALLGYGDSITYTEGLGCSSRVGAYANSLGLASFGLLAAFPPTRFVLRNTVLPKPGEGPSKENMLKGYLKVYGVARGKKKGNTATSKMSFPVDPGYMDTARMLIESALCFVLDADKLKHVPGGSYTPASCQGEVLLDRLCATGTTFECT